MKRNVKIEWTEMKTANRGIPIWKNWVWKKCWMLSESSVISITSLNIMEVTGFPR
jgi:hypothetical protein